MGDNEYTGVCRAKWVVYESKSLRPISRWDCQYRITKRKALQAKCYQWLFLTLFLLFLMCSSICLVDVYFSICDKGHMSCLPCIRCYTTMYCPCPKQFTKSFPVDEFSLAPRSLSCTCPLTGVSLENAGLLISLPQGNEEVRTPSLEVKQDISRPIKFQNMFHYQIWHLFVIISNTWILNDLDI